MPETVTVVPNESYVTFVSFTLARTAATCSLYLPDALVIDSNNAVVSGVYCTSSNERRAAATVLFQLEC